MSYYPGANNYGAAPHYPAQQGYGPPQGGYQQQPQYGQPQYGQPPYQGGGYAPQQGFPPQPQYGGPQQFNSPPPQVAPYSYNQPPPQQTGYGAPPPQPNGYPGPRPGMPTVYGNHAGGPPPPPKGGQQFGHGAPSQYQFQYSNCTGKRKALLIGINYFGQRGTLRGCINDVKNMSTYLNQNFGYARADMVLLTDDQQNEMSIPNKKNILRAMHWLVKDAQPNDSLFFHYSVSHFRS